VVFASTYSPSVDHDGTFTVELLGAVASEQRYDGHTPVLVTMLTDASGNAIELRDFAPRFANHGRTFRPTMLIRRLRPLRGEPRIQWIILGVSHPGAALVVGPVLIVGPYSLARALSNRAAGLPGHG